MNKQKEQYRTVVGLLRSDWGNLSLSKMSFFFNQLIYLLLFSVLVRYAILGNSKTSSYLVLERILLISTFMGSALSISTEYFDKYEDRILLELGSWRNRFWSRIININIFSFSIVFVYVLIMRTSKLLPVNFNGYRIRDFLEFLLSNFVASALGTALSLIFRNILITGAITGLVVFGLDINPEILNANMHYGGINYLVNPLLNSRDISHLVVAIFAFGVGIWVITISGEFFFNRPSLSDVISNRFSRGYTTTPQIPDIAHSRYFWKKLFRVNRDYGIVLSQFTSSKINLILLPVASITFCLFPFFSSVQQFGILGGNSWSPIFVSTIINSFFAVQIYLGAYGNNKSFLARESLLYRSPKDYLVKTLNWNSMFYLSLSISVYVLTMAVASGFHGDGLSIRLFGDGVLTLVVISPIFSLVSILIVYSKLPTKSFMLIPYLYIYINTFLGERFPQVTPYLPISLIANFAGGKSLSVLLQGTKNVNWFVLYLFVALLLVARYIWFPRSSRLSKMTSV